MKKIVMSVVLAFTTVLGAETDVESHGGVLVRPGTGIKSIAVVNVQKRLAQSEIDALARMIDEQTHFNIRSLSSDVAEPTALMKSSGSELVVIVRDDPKLPTLLVAPEDRWAVVNVAKLVDDLPSENAKKKFFVSRARKEIIRGFSLLCGGGLSQFEGNAMNAATMRKLDFAREGFPIDMVDKYTRYLEQLGFKAKSFALYEDACQEGWAPAPTNDVQRKIWKDVYTPPSNPIKIKYDPKKGK